MVTRTSKRKAVTPVVGTPTNKKSKKETVTKVTTSGSKRNAAQTASSCDDVDEDIIKDMNELVSEKIDKDEESKIAAQKAAHAKRIKIEAATKKLLTRRIAALEKKKQEDKFRGVLYLGNIPYGFFEKEMKTFFSQFGVVKRLRISRSKSSGNSRGYAFIEFENKEVADVVADTMDNYLMFDRVLKAKVIPTDKVHPFMFKNADREFKVIDWKQVEINKRESEKSQTEQAHQFRSKRLIAKENQLRAKIAKLGMDYEFEGYSGAMAEEKKKVKNNASSSSSKKKAVSAAAAASKSSNKKNKKNNSTKTSSKKGRN